MFPNDTTLDIVTNLWCDPTSKSPDFSDDSFKNSNTLFFDSKVQNLSDEKLPSNSEDPIDPIIKETTKPPQSFKILFPKIKNASTFADKPINNLEDLNTVKAAPPIISKLKKQLSNLNPTVHRFPPNATYQKRWRLYCFQHAFVLEPNIPNKGIKFLEFNSGRVVYPFRDHLKPRPTVSLKNCKTNEKAGLPQLIIYRHVEKILEVKDHYHDRYDSFGLLDCLFLVDAILGIIHIADATFLAVVKDHVCVGGFSLESFSKISEPISKFWNARVYNVKKAWLIPFHLSMERLHFRVSHLKPNTRYALSKEPPLKDDNSYSDHIRSRPRHKSIKISSFTRKGHSASRAQLKKSESSSSTIFNSNNTPVLNSSSPTEHSLSFDAPKADVKVSKSYPNLSKNYNHNSKEFPTITEPNWGSDTPGFGDLYFNELLGEKLSGYKHSVESLLSSKIFYYSHDIDITNTLQKKRLMNYSFSPQSWPCDHDGGNTSLLDLADRRFIWNLNILKPFENIDKKWFTPLTQGAICIASVSTEDNSGADFVLISRRSSARAGTRYNARGIDDNGAVGNFNENEQMIFLWNTIKNKPQELMSAGWSAYVQIRGSVPLFWKQNPTSMMLKFSTQLTRELKFTTSAFEKHVEELKDHYGSICFVNLLSKIRVCEQRLSEYFKRLLHHMNDLNTDINNLSYFHWDFHYLVKSEGLEAALKSILMQLERVTASYGYYSDEVINNLGNVTQPRKYQHGVIRTNCLDCLDRTNALQWWLAWSWVLFYLTKRRKNSFFISGHCVPLSNLFRRSSMLTRMETIELYNTKSDLQPKAHSALNSNEKSENFLNSWMRQKTIPPTISYLMTEFVKAPLVVFYSNETKGYAYLKDIANIETSGFISLLTSIKILSVFNNGSDTQQEWLSVLPASIEDLYLQRHLVKNLCKDIIAQLWAEQVKIYGISVDDLGDSISFAYTGTGSVVSELIRQGKTTIKTTFDHYKKSLNRIYQNTFEDQLRQEAIELLLCEHQLLSPVVLSKQVWISKAVRTQFSQVLLSRISRKIFYIVNSLRIWIGTWNLGGKPITEPLENWILPENTPSADLYFIAFQEFVELTSVHILFPQSDKEKALKLNSDIQKALGESFLLLQSHTLVGLHAAIFIKEKYKKLIYHVQVMDVKLGFKRQMGNKGAVLLRLQFGGTSFCFINVHFSAGTEKLQKRKSQLSTVLNSTFATRPSFATYSHDCVFLGGDLNFRCDVTPEICDPWVKNKKWFKLLLYDQLLMHKNSSDILLENLHEAPITFPPTYKFIRGTHIFDKARVPSWCDRVLYSGDYLKHEHTKKWIRCLEYQRYSNFLSSDHKPVHAIFQVSVLTYPH